MTKYYPINEAAARSAKRANSFDDYMEGSETASYQRMVDAATEVAERQKKRVDPEYYDRIDGLLDSYARKLAENMNASYRIDASCPSVLIAGGSNFPVRKKEKQNARRDKNMAEWREIQGILETIRSVGMGGIMSDDPRAVDKLRKKLEKLETTQALMKSANAYFRKHHTLLGCPDLSPELIRSVTSAMESSYRSDPVPFEAYELSNNNANIRRIRERIAALEKEAARAASAASADRYGEGYTLRENSTAGRIQFVFDGKPDETVRAMLKSYGFRWAPSEGAWQRMLNDNGRSAAERVIRYLDAAKKIESGLMCDDCTDKGHCPEYLSGEVCVNDRK